MNKSQIKKRKQILYIGNQLQRHGFNPTTIDLLAPRLEIQYDVIQVSNKKNTLFRIVDMVYSIVRYQSTARLVLIDVYSTRAFYYFITIATLCRLISFKYVPLLHGGDLPLRLQNNPKFCKWVFGNAARIVSPSLYLQNAFLVHGFQSIYIPNFVDTLHYPYKQRNELTPRLLYVRSFHKIYNPLLTIEVFYKLTKLYPMAHLCMVGPDKDGTKKVAEERVKQLGLSSSVTFTGKLSKRDWVDLSASYDIFISTTSVDNMPVSLIEAMLLGIPILSSCVGGVPYLLQNDTYGYSVKNGQVNDYVNLLNYMISHPQEVLVRAHAARIHALQFDWEQVKHKWFNLIEEVDESV
jgi:glycosyltransferase involved in cell wall biosynthesis